MKENAIKTIVPYKLYPYPESEFYSWVFDDPSVGLVKEALVAGADTVCDILSAGEQSFIIHFADFKFPTAKIHIELMPEDEDVPFGSNYYCPELKKVLWLCPALLKYFDTPPKSIWVDYITSKN